MRRAAEANGDGKVTVFELLSAVGFLLFSEHPADAVLLEVGLGGRFDATNVIERPAVTAVTSISLDHQAYLGDSVELIAAEKAGIFKRGSPVVIGPQTETGALEVLRDKAARTGAPVFVYGQDFHAISERGASSTRTARAFSTSPCRVCPAGTRSATRRPPSPRSARPASPRPTPRSRPASRRPNGPDACSASPRGRSWRSPPKARRSGSTAATIRAPAS